MYLFMIALLWIFGVDFLVNSVLVSLCLVVFSYVVGKSLIWISEKIDS